MALWLVVRTDEADWDEYRSVVVRAKNEGGALAIATHPCAVDDDGYKHAFHGFNPDGSNLRVERLESTGRAVVILADFKAA